MAVQFATDSSRCSAIILEGLEENFQPFSYLQDEGGYLASAAYLFCVPIECDHGDNQSESLKGHEPPCARRGEVAKTDRGQTGQAVAPHIGDQKPERWADHLFLKSACHTQERRAKTDTAKDTAYFKGAVWPAYIDAKVGRHNFRLEEREEAEGEKHQRHSPKKDTYPHVSLSTVFLQAGQRKTPEATSSAPGGGKVPLADRHGNQLA